MAGSLSGWPIPDFEPIAMIPSGTRLTAFHSDTLRGDAGTRLLQHMVRQVEAGAYRPRIDRVLTLDGLTSAHRDMENNRAIGKLVLLP